LKGEGLYDSPRPRCTKYEVPRDARTEMREPRKVMREEKVCVHCLDYAIYVLF
jgi:hypothetical protein